MQLTAACCVTEISLKKFLYDIYNEETPRKFTFSQPPAFPPSHAVTKLHLNHH